jgi:hypothetical protein
METGYPNGTATLVALADGTTSLCLSSGGGIIGGGQHTPVAEATRRLLHIAERHLTGMVPAADTDLPVSGRVRLRALAYHGQYSVDAAEDDLGYRRHPLWPVFHAAHDVITQLRILDEQDHTRA